MHYCENNQVLNCIIADLEQLKKYIRELEERVKGLENK